MVIRDGTSSSNFSEVSQAIPTTSSRGESERKVRNRAVREKHLSQLEGYVEKYRTRFLDAINLEKEKLIMAMNEVILDLEAGTTSYRALEIVVTMSQVSPIDK